MIGNPILELTTKKLTLSLLQMVRVQTSPEFYPWTIPPRRHHRHRPHRLLRRRQVLRCPRRSFLLR